jgi:hypothetical protein
MSSRGTGPDESKERPSASSQETARFIADMSNELSVIARKAGLEVLAYLLDMVRLEAEEIAQKEKAQKDTAQ